MNLLMNEWTVVTVIAALIGLFFTVGKPIIDLNKNITALNITVQQNSADICTQRKDAEKSHQKLWDHNGEQDKTLADHETRISVLEQK